MAVIFFDRHLFFSNFQYSLLIELIVITELSYDVHANVK